MLGIAFEKYKIGELGKVVTGRTPPSSKPECFGEEYPFITPGDMHNRKKANTTDRYLSVDGAKLLKNNLIPSGSVSVSCIGWQMGKSIMVSRPSFTNQQLNTVIPNDKVDPDYLYYSLVTRRDEFFSLGSGVGVRTPILNKSAFSNLEILLPSLKYQKKIAEVLSVYDNLIENNNRRIAILEEMAQSLYREWFVKFRFPGHEGTKFIDSPLGKIPEGWGVTKIKDIGEVITGKTPSKKKPEYYSSCDVPFLKTPDMHGNIFVTVIEDWLSKEGADSQKNKYIPAGSVCVACIGAKAGVVALIPTSVQTNQQINSVVFYDKKMREYFYLFASGFNELIRALGSSGATMTNVSKGKFENIEFIKPAESVLEGFHNAISSCFDMILNSQKKNKGLKEARDLLLPKLISGKINLL